MRRTAVAAIAAVVAFALSPSAQTAPGPLSVSPPQPIHGAHYPALSPDGKSLCFSYRGDLWTVSAAGGVATRLTVHPAYDGWPHWSPDGNWIAFSSNRTGNYDVYVIPARGGEPQQITFNSADDIVCDWSPDGSRIMFMSPRDGRFPDLYTIGVKDKRLRRLTKDGSASRYGAFLPDGRSVVYARGGQSWWRPTYTGSQRNAIYRVGVADLKATPLVQHDGMDSWPLPTADGKSIVFVSERDGAANLWRAPLDGGTAKQLTHQSGDSLRFPAIARDGSVLAYESGFGITVMPLHGASVGEPKVVTIYAPSDLTRNATDRVTLTSGASAVELSPDGASLALVLRGEIWTVKSDGGDAKRVTHGQGISDNPTWSADGSMIAYTSERNDTQDVYVADVKTLAETRLTSDRDDTEMTSFAPDGRKLAFVRPGGRRPGLYVIDVPAAAAPGAKSARPEAVRLADGPNIESYEWSPDARWIAYSRADATAAANIWIVRAVGGAPFNVTRYPTANVDPHWTRDGKLLVFSSRRPAEESSSSNLYAIELKPKPPSDDDTAASTPGAPASEMQPPALSSGLDEPGDQRRVRRFLPPSAAGGDGAPTSGPVPPRARLVQIEFDGIEKRARQVTSLREEIGTAQLSPDSHTAVFTMNAAGRTNWWAADLATGSLSPVSPAALTGDYARFSPDGGTFTFIGPGGALYRVTRGSGGVSSVGFSAAAEIDHRAEMAKAFEQAWRTLRTRFYDRNMHGVDWDALRARYEPLLAETTESEDLAWLLSSMIGELNASHLGAMAPQRPGPTVETGCLGLTFYQDYAGPGMRVAEVLPNGPSDQPGHRIRAGWYVFAIDGTDVTWTEDTIKLLRDRVGQKVDLLVSLTPSKDAARVITVKPISQGAAEDLAYEQWVTARRRKVDELSGGRVAYIHIRQMNQPGLERFRRELFGDAQKKEALVLDVRNNGGGRIHDELLALLTRRPHGYETPRDGERSSQPYQLWNRPIALLVNEFSASDAEVFPNGFREFHLGKIVGTQTAGAVIGTYNIALIDGTTFRVPTTGWVTLDGKPMENHGVEPDIPVAMTPADYAADRDPQLEAAVREALAEIKPK